MTPAPQSPDEPLTQNDSALRATSEHRPSRRQFTKVAILASLAMFLGNLWILFRSWIRQKSAFPRLVIARVGEIPVDGSKIFQYPKPDAPCILVRTAAGTYVAYSRICTHQACVVFYRPEDGVFQCPCHGGLFSVANGSVLQGPPTQPLPRILLEERGENLVAVGIQNG